MSVDLKFLIRESLQRLLEDDTKFAEGETVKTTDGKKGEITLAKHPFYGIMLGNGTTASYHFSDLIKQVQEKMEYTGDNKDLSPALEFHIKNGLSLFENKTIHLGLPFLGEPEFLNEAEDKKDPPIGKPKRGGSKKFYVYVKNPKTGNIKKVSFGDTTGLRAKLNNPKARKAFAARHKCAQKKDRTKASYWSCRLPRYAKLLGFKTSFSGFW